MNAILAPIMEQVLELEQDCGRQFSINGQKRKFSGTIAFVSGDNLGSQEWEASKLDLALVSNAKTQMFRYN